MKTPKLKQMIYIPRIKFELEKAKKVVSKHELNRGPVTTQH